jgi:hypothetical protein
MDVDEELISLGELVKDKEADCVDKSQQVEDIQNVQVQEEVMQPNGEQEVVQANKRQKRQWGPSLRVDRPRRAPEDERTVMQKAQDLKKDRDKMQGMAKTTSFAFESNEVLLQKAKSVNISFGTDDKIVHEKLNNLKSKELGDIVIF